MLVEYLEAAVYSTLARRGVYPAETFELQLLYGIPVRRTRSPALVEYVEEFIEALLPLVRTGAAKAVCLVITTEEPALVALERHIFSFALVGEAQVAAVALAEKRARPPPVSHADAEDLVTLQRLLAEAVMALDRADASLPTLPPGTPFLLVPCGAAADCRAKCGARAECTFHLEVLSSDYGDDADRSVFWLTKEVLLDHMPPVFPPLGPVVVPVHFMGDAQKAPLLKLSVVAERLNASQPSSAPHISPPYEEAYML